MTSFGAFVEVFPGVEGLVHISQIAHEHIATPNDVLSTGEKVRVKVLEVHPDAHRLHFNQGFKEKPAGSEERHEQPKQRVPRKQAAPTQMSTDDDDEGFTLGDLVGDQLKNAQRADSDNK